MAATKSSGSSSGDLVEYYGTECHFCIQMAPLIDQLEKELKVKVVKKECWHNAANQADFMKVAAGKCQGVPFFINNKTGKFICGAASYDRLKAWAQGK
jgi:thiol-disulfide isomerase/thioredoxin